MRLLVAGGSGFVGRAITGTLTTASAQERGIQVMTLSRSGLTPGASTHRHLSCDLTEAADHPEIRRFAPQVIINAVGDSHPRNSIGREAALIETNLLPFLRLLDTARAEALERVVFLSSAGALYHSALEAQLKPASDSAYFSIKQSTETLLNSWCAAHEIRGVSVRLTNPVGNNNKAGFGVVNHFARALARGDEVRFIGDYQVFKDYIHIRDAAEAIERLATGALPGSWHRVFDLGSGIALTAEGIHAALQAIAQGASVPDGICRRSTLNLAELEQATGWRPQHDVLEMFREIYLSQKAAL